MAGQTGYAVCTDRGALRVAGKRGHVPDILGVRTIVASSFSAASSLFPGV